MKLVSCNLLHCVVVSEKYIAVFVNYYYITSIV
jgi:hypothetical protein